MHKTNATQIKVGGLTLAAAAALMVMGVSSARAATVTNTYTGASGDYNTAGNWNKSRVPGTDGTDFDNAVIGNGATVSLSDDLSAAPRLYSINVNGGSTLTLNSGGVITTQDNNWSDGWINIGSGGPGEFGNGTTSGNLVVNAGATMNVKTLQFAHNSTFTMNGGTINARSRQLYIGTTSGQTVTANLNGGTLSNFNGGTALAVGAHGNANVTQDGATVYIDTSGWNPNYLGQYSGSTGNWDMKSGTFYVNTLYVGNVAGATGSLNISGGDFHTTLYMNVGGLGNGTVTISGGSFDTPSSTPVLSPSSTAFAYGDGMRQLWIGTGTGTGLFKVVGNDATINVTQTGNTQNILTLGANGTLAFDVDAATVTTIHVAGAGGSPKVQNATLGGTIDLNLINGYLPTLGATYDLLSATGTIADAGYSLAAGDENNWSLAINPILDINNHVIGQKLVATYVPEPGCLTLMGVGGMALLRRRRNAVFGGV